MKRILLLTLILNLCACVTIAQQTVTMTSGGNANLEQELRRIARERILAFDLGGRNLWSPYVADGYIIATPSGPNKTKEQVMQGIPSVPCRIQGCV